MLPTSCTIPPSSMVKQRSNKIKLMATIKNYFVARSIKHIPGRLKGKHLLHLRGRSGSHRAARACRFWMITTYLLPSAYRATSVSSCKPESVHKTGR
eukprot:1153122-Pelagomonas_calceolata.AAC.3